MSNPVVEAEILAILEIADLPVTTAQILNKYSTNAMVDAQIGGVKNLPKITKKEVNSVLFKLKGDKLQCYSQFSPPSWSIIGRFTHSPLPAVAPLAH
jgi:hypothetical protein